MIDDLFGWEVGSNLFTEFCCVNQMNQDLRNCLGELFRIARERLAVREVVLTHDPSAVETLLSSLSLDLHPVTAVNSAKHLWHSSVADPIEQLLLNGVLKAGDNIHVSADLTFQIETPDAEEP